MLLSAKDRKQFKVTGRPLRCAQCTVNQRVRWFYYASQFDPATNKTLPPKWVEGSGVITNVQPHEWIKPGELIRIRSDQSKREFSSWDFMTRGGIGNMSPIYPAG